MGRTPSESSAGKSEHSTSVIRSIPPPAQKKFCLTAQEFHDERGLSLIGVDPRNLHGKQDISDKIWSDVFTCLKPAIGSNKKVKAYHVKREFAERLVHRHWDVYQEGIVFYEVTQSFAKGFALEHCSAAKKAAGKEDHTVAWASFAERAMKSSKEHHNLDNKRNKWEDLMLYGGASKQVKTEARGGHQDVVGPKLLFDPLQLMEVDNMITSGQRRVILAKKAVEDAVLAVEDATRSLHRAEGRRENPLIGRLKNEIATLTTESDRQRMLDWLQVLQQQDAVEDLDKLAEDVARVKVSACGEVLFS